jgi:RNA polymerase sigma factor (sigma-70 family)
MPEAVRDSSPPVSNAPSSSAPPMSAESHPGPASTWEAMVQLHFARVYRHAFHLTHNQQDAEDLTQETFIRVFRGWSSYKPGSVEGWLHRITLNLFINDYRRRRRTPFCVPLEEGKLALPSSGQTPAEILDGLLLAPDVEDALRAITPAFRNVVILIDAVGLSRTEVARLIGVKPATVSTRLFRGRQQLRVLLAHRLPATG